MLKKIQSVFGRSILLLAVAFAAAATRAENDPRLYAVEVAASVQTAPAQINLSWPADANATGYTISRKLPSATAWTSIANLAGGAISFIDSNVSVGGAYEYRIAKTSTLGVNALGYIVAGINAPLVDSRGKLVLVVDNTYAASLASELVRLQQDLTGDGWTVIRKDVPPTLSAPEVKALIKTEFDADRANVKSVFLFGHVAVPRSGNINPDGHADHQGAWAADSYYADMDGAWTDSTVNNTSAARTENWNVPGDGNFDQSSIPSDLELAVGRVDLSNMTCFANKIPARSELDLLRAYLNKDHNFRHGLISVPRRGLVSDNFGEMSGEAFAVTGWRSFAPMFGSTNTVKVGYGQYFPTLSSQGYLFSYACGGGSYYTCAGVGGSDDFSTNEVKTVFSMLFGSYFGDWDNESNFLRAILGSGSALTVSWSGRPLWFYHHMALGETIGFSARLSQNNDSGGLYERQNYGSRNVNNVLLGDPSLRLHPVMPISALTGSNSSSGLVLTWKASADSAIQGYNVYRSAVAAGPFSKVNSSLLSATSFIDTAALTSGVYMVRAVKLESTPSGTYFNPSQGIFHTNGAAASPPPGSTTTNTTSSTPTVSKFVKSDLTTSGNWTNVYGGEGNWIYSASPKVPTYATVTPVNNLTWIWSSQPTRTAAPLLPNNTTNRVAACWYADGQFSMDVSIKDGQAHRLSAYFLDWDAIGRKARIELVNLADGSVITSHTNSNFSNGIYLVWDIVGNVRIRLTPLYGNAVMSALYFDAAGTNQTTTTAPPANTVTIPAAPSNLTGTVLSSNQVKLAWADNSTNETAFLVFRKTGFSGTYAQIAALSSNVTGFTNSALAASTDYYFKICASNAAGASAFTGEMLLHTAAATPATSSTNSAVFIQRDTTTLGTWTNHFGTEGYSIAGVSPAVIPSYVTVTAQQASDWIWNTGISELPAVLLPNAKLATDRIASCWYSFAPFSFEFAFKDTNPHRVAFYMLDWDFAGRVAQVDMIDVATGAILNTQTVSNFENGLYLVYDLTGNVRLKITPKTGNGVVSGIFFGTK